MILDIYDRRPANTSEVITPLLVVTNLQKAALLPNITAGSRRRIADILSASLYGSGGNGKYGGGSSSSGGSSSNFAQVVAVGGDRLFAQSVALVTTVVQRAAKSEAGAKLEIGTAQGFIEAFSSTLRLTAGRDSEPPPTNDDSAVFNRRAIAKSVEAVAMVTNRSAPETSVVARSISFRRQTIQASGGGLVEFSSYDGKGSRQQAALRVSDVQGLAPPSHIRISSSLLTASKNSKVGKAFVLRIVYL